jgi:hypothetical protein
MEQQYFSTLLRGMSVPQLPPLQAPRLLDQVRERVRYLHYSIRTEQAYVHLDARVRALPPYAPPA